MVSVQLLAKVVHGHEGLSTWPGSVGRDKLTTSHVFYHPIGVGVFAESSITDGSIEGSILHTAETNLRKTGQSLPRIRASSTEKLNRKRNKTKNTIETRQSRKVHGYVGYGGERAGEIPPLTIP